MCKVREQLVRSTGDVIFSPDRAALGQLLGRAPAPAAQRAPLQLRQLILHVTALQRLELALQVVRGPQLRRRAYIGCSSATEMYRAGAVCRKAFLPERCHAVNTHTLAHHSCQ